LAGRGCLRSFGRGGVPIRARTHLVRPLLVVVTLTAFGCNNNDGVSWIGFHGNALRTGWNPQETKLRPDVVQSGRFGKRWESPAFDSFNGIPGRAYASPLFVEGVKVVGVVNRLARRKGSRVRCSSIRLCVHVFGCDWLSGLVGSVP